MNNKKTADHINSFFSSLTNDFLEVRGDWLARGELDPLPSITDENVAKRLSDLDLTVGKAAGPYDPYIKLIKMFAKYFAIPLADIYNESFMSRIFPQIWKFYTVCVIPKITPCSNVEDLRPISLTSVLSKVQESYVVEWVHEGNKRKSERCSIRRTARFFGSLSTCPSCTQLVFGYGNGNVVRIIFLDFRKAFDLIDHNKLLQNFEKIGVRPALLAWLGSYLQGRSQVTKVGNTFFDPAYIKGGVPTR
jgi:DNA-binding XRE family transcriptional regulator